MAESIHYHGSDTPPLTYRLSCVRSDSKNKYTYSRREFLTVVADGAMKLRHCKVNLRHYDFEVCFLVRDHALAIGIALRPYQRIPTTSFAGGDCQPPDIHPPYNGCNKPHRGLVTLRPATAQLLLHLCQLQAGDVMLDPCVGTGTICSETEFQKSHVAAIGGDLALTPTGLATVAIERQQHSRSRASLVAWDSCCQSM
jgi:tRNA G10  N-methylase Trm11